MKTVAKAIRYASEHDLPMCKDGAYNVDLQEVKSMPDVFQLLIDTLMLSIKAELNAIINDTFLKSKQITLVFNNLPFHDKVLIGELLKFIDKLHLNTQLVLIIVIKEHNYQDLADLPKAEMFTEVRMEFMKKKEAIEFLERLIFIEKKTQFVRNIDFETHKLIE